MPSVGDVYNQLVTANANLQQLHNDVAALTAATKSVKDAVDQVNATDTKGFADVLNALSVLIKLGQYQAAALFHISDQDDSIICNLDKISRQTCEILTESTIQTALQRDMEKDVDRLVEMEETVHPAAALELSRAEQVRARIDECCEKAAPPLACTYSPCPAPASTLGPPPNLGDGPATVG